MSLPRLGVLTLAFTLALPACYEPPAVEGDGEALRTSDVDCDHLRRQVTALEQDKDRAVAALEGELREALADNESAWDRTLAAAEADLAEQLADLRARVARAVSQIDREYGAEIDDLEQLLRRAIAAGDRRAAARIRAAIESTQEAWDAEIRAVYAGADAEEASLLEDHRHEVARIDGYFSGEAEDIEDWYAEAIRETVAYYDDLIDRLIGACTDDPVRDVDAVREYGRR